MGYRAIVHNLQGRTVTGPGDIKRGVVMGGLRQFGQQSGWDLLMGRITVLGKGSSLWESEGNRTSRPGPGSLM